MFFVDVGLAHIFIHKVLMHFKLKHLELINTVLNFKTDMSVLRAISFIENVSLRHLIALLFLFNSFDTKGFKSVEQLNC